MIRIQTGFTTGDEYWSGTDPIDGTSYLQIDDVEVTSSNLMIYWRHSQVDPGLPPLWIQHRSNLTSGIWLNAGTNAPVDGTNSFAAPLPFGPFFRLRVPGAP